LRTAAVTPQRSRRPRPDELQHGSCEASADGLVTDLQPAFRQQILDITVAQGEAQVEPDRVPDHNWRKAVAGVRHAAAWISLASFGREPCVNVSTSAAGHMGLTGEDAARYALSIVEAELAGRDDKAIVKKVCDDLVTRGFPIVEQDVRQQLQVYSAKARAQLATRCRR
jgi:hypothetical protein